MTYLPTIENEIRPWFEQHGFVLEDVRSFLAQLERARGEMEYCRCLLTQFQAFGMDEEAAALTVEIQGALELMAEIEMAVHNLKQRGIN